MERPGLRLGVLIGALATATIALAVAVVVLVAGDSGSTTTTVVTTQGEATTTSDCPTTSGGGPARIDLGSSGLTCEEAGSVSASYDAKISGGTVRSTNLEVRVGEWRCRSYPFAEYPLLVACQTDTQHRFEVLGTAPSAHQPGQP